MARVGSQSEAAPLQDALMPGKILKLSAEMVATLEQLYKSGTFQEIVDEAFADLLKKHHRPTTLKGALKQKEQNDGSEQSDRRQRPKRRRAKAHAA